MCNKGTQTEIRKLNIILASMIIKIWAGCVKRIIGHYYKPHLKKYKLASNKKNLYPGGSEN